MSASSIAVVIPTRDRPEDLRRALTSVWAQASPPDEVIVVDDASEAPVDDAIFAGAPAGVGVLAMRNDTPLGANAARNRGIAAANSAYVAFLDDDDEFMPRKIERLRAAIVQSGAGIVHHGALVRYDNEGISYPTRVNRDVTFSTLLTGNKVGGMSLACARRELLQSLGGLDETLPALQDWDVWLRAAQSGATFHAIDEPLTLYHFATGKPAISKSVDRLSRAISIIDGKFAAALAAMPPEDRRRRGVTDVTRYAHRLAMNEDRLGAARTYFTGGLRHRKLKLLAAAPLALLGIRYLAMLRRVVG